MNWQAFVSGRGELIGVDVGVSSYMELPSHRSPIFYNFYNF